MGEHQLLLYVLGVFYATRLTSYTASLLAETSFRPYAGPNILVGGGLQVVVRGEAADDI